jgi:hypothetical protein
MPSNFNTILLLVVLLIVWKFFGKRILAFVLTRSVARGALLKIGNDAVQKQPDWITLERVSDAAWTNPATANDLIQPLLSHGFTDAGSYTVDKMPGVKLAILIKPDEHITAHVYEHPKAGTWIELVTRYQDGTCQTVSTLPSTGIQPPPWVKTVRAAKAPAMDLVRQLTFVRRSGDMKKIEAGEAVREFEEGYAKSIVWQKNNGLTPEEVASVVRDWAANKEMQSEIQSYNSGA